MRRKPTNLRQKGVNRHLKGFPDQQKRTRIILLSRRFLGFLAGGDGKMEPRFVQFMNIPEVTLALNRQIRHGYFSTFLIPGLT